ncbi:MAG: hypothetical protein CSB48_12605 [Proteobacteria bacterium]|nr:MAG: hypothetical protein CSB48_12605 [Pseudomonadota bacterium]
MASTRERASTREKTSTTNKAPTKKTLKAVKVNQATWQELAQSLPGIGEKRARAIVDYRKKNGKFKKADDLLNIPGIGEKILREMKPYLKI